MPDCSSRREIFGTGWMSPGVKVMAHHDQRSRMGNSVVTASKERTSLDDDGAPPQGPTDTPEDFSRYTIAGPLEAPILWRD
jgi:hypothetical protein